MQRKWPGKSIKVCFFDGSPDVNKAVANVARQWTLYGNIEFDFGDWKIPRLCSPSERDNDVRASYNGVGNWSYVGVESKVHGGNGTTLNIESLKDKPSNEITISKYNANILHEFGHALGFLHTWSLPSANCEAEIDWQKAYAVFGAQFGGSPEKFQEEMVQALFGSPGPGRVIVGSFDRRSVMSYELPAEIFLKGRESPCFTTPSPELSLRDKLAMFTIYK